MNKQLKKKIVITLGLVVVGCFVTALTKIRKLDNDVIKYLDKLNCLRYNCVTIKILSGGTNL